MRRIFRPKYIVFLVGASFLLCMLLGVRVLSNKDLSGGLGDWFRSEEKEAEMEQAKDEKQGVVVAQVQTPATAKLHENEQAPEKNAYPAPNHNLHTFYYPWYGNPEFDGKYLHWNHPFIPHWNKKEAKKWPSGRHTPPDDIGSNYYPALGAYSSRDPKVIDDHMQQMRTAGIGE